MEYLFISLIAIIICIIIATIIIVYRHKHIIQNITTERDSFVKEIESINREKEKETQKTNFLKNLSRLLPDFNDLKSSNNLEELFTKFHTIQELLAKYLKAEYCTIGLIKNKIIYEKSYWAPDYNKETDDIFNNINTYPYDERTLFGSFLMRTENYHNEEIFTWSKRDNKVSLKKYIKDKGLSIHDKFLESYKKILLSRDVNNILLIPIFIKKEIKREIIGYVNIFNVRNDEKMDFTKGDITIISETANRLGKKISDFFIYQQLMQDKSDDHFLLDISKEQKISSIFDLTLKHLSSEFNSDVNSIFIPVMEDFDNKISNLQLHLRSIYCNNFEKILQNDIEESINDIDNISVEKFLDTSKFIDSNGDILFIHNNDNPLGKDLKKIIPDFPEKMLLIPIYVTGDQKSEWWKNCRAIVLIHPKGFLDENSLKDRLKNLSIQIGLSIEDLINKEINSHIKKLNYELKHFNFGDEDAFYSKLKKLICDIIECEKSEILLINGKEQKYLTTKDSYSKGGTNQPRYSIIHNDNSIIIRSFREQKSAVISKATTHSKCINYINCEEKYDCLMVTPLINSNNKSIGVIKCIGKKKNNENLIHVFWEKELELMQLIVSISMKLMEGFESFKDRKNFIKLTVHELRQPLQSITNIFDILERILSGNIKDISNNRIFIKDLVNECSEELALTNVMFSDLEFLYTDNDIKIAYKKKMQDIIPSIHRVAKLMQSYAHADKNININVRIKQVPIEGIVIDKERFEQVLINLLKNAIRYSTIGGRDIELYYNYDHDGNWHKFEIIDWGIGFEKEDVINEDIFRLYRRSERAKLHDVLGNGIGLYVAKKIIVEGHGGMIKIMNLRNPTNVTIYIPA